MNFKPFDYYSLSKSRLSLILKLNVLDMLLRTYVTGIGAESQIVSATYHMPSARILEQNSTSEKTKLMSDTT